MGAWRILEKPGDIHIYIKVAVTSEPWLRIPRDNEFRLLPVRLCNTLFGWSELWVRRNFGLGATFGWDRPLGSKSGYVEPQPVLAGRRRLTRDSRVSVVSLEIPGIVVSLEIPVFRIFLVKISGKIVKIGFSDSRDQNKILKF